METQQPEAPAIQAGDTDIGMSRNRRRFQEKQIERAGAARSVHELAAMREVVGQLNATAQMSARLAYAVITREMEITKVVANDTSLLVIYSDKPVNEQVAKEIMDLLKMPLVELPKSMRFDAVSAEQMEAAGWVRKQPPVEVAPE